MLFKFNICFKHVTNVYAGKNSVFATSYFPAVDLSNGNYKFGLTDFETYYSISNVNSSNNKFYFDKMT